MQNIEHRINRKEYMTQRAIELGFSNYTEALREYHAHGLKPDDIAHVFNRNEQSVKKHLTMLGID